MSDLEGFEKFCGGPFWDINLTWNTDTPDFTPCFQMSALVWVPCALLWLLLVPYSCYLSTVKGPGIPVNKLNSAKTLLALILVAVCLLDLFKTVAERGNDQDTALIYLVSPIVLAVTFILVVILVQVERKKGFITSGVLFVFFLALTIAGIVPFYSKIINPIDDVYRTVTFYVYYAMVVVMLLLFCFTDSKPHRSIYSNKKPCPEALASFPSRITFEWITSLVFLGYKKGLVEDDIWELNPRDMTRTSAPQFQKEWEKELRRCGIINHKPKPHQPRLSNPENDFNSPVSYGEKSPLLNSRESEVEIITGSDKDKKKKKSPSLFKVMSKTCGPTLLTAFACKFVCDILTFIGPTLQGLVITYTEDQNIQQWKGYLYAALFFINSVVTSCFFHQNFHIGMTLGMRSKAVVISAVYKKALTMSNEARKTSTVGEIVNLMSVDAQRLQDVMGYLWMVWSSPLQIVIAVYLLWGTVGPSVLAGLGVMILLIPVNGVMAAYQRKLQIAQMKTKDARIKLMNEVLNGMKVLKLYAWELSFKEKVAVIRNFELATLQKYAYLSSFGTFTWTCAPFLVILATFSTYVLTGGVLDPNTAFVSLSLFNILRFPMNMLPMMISYLVTASVSIKRLGAFLQNVDLDDDNVQHNPKTVDPITIDNGIFSWGTGKDDPDVLKNINLSVKEGSLVAVVGQVGSGKSSLVSAMLGEMEKKRGRVNVRGSIAYVAQQAWIQNNTLRDNILFGHEYDEEKYNKVLDACALRPDLEILPGGDQTEIGEKGINLSGGQKQRVSLARAVYSNCDIYFMDDPLSAVDSHVGKHIFEEVVGDNGLLHNKTRILVTHGVHWLPNVDQILVFVNGEISEVGSYDELLTHNGAFAQFLKTFLLQEDSESEESDPEYQELKAKMLERVDSVLPEGESVVSQPSYTTQPSKVSQGGSELGSDSSPSKVKRQKSRKKGTKRSGSKLDEDDKPRKPAVGEKLIEEEKSERGTVKMGVFIAYCRALGLMNAFMILFFYLIYQVASVYSNIWLSQWTEDATLKNASLVNTTKYTKQQDLYLGVYGGLGLLQAAAVLVYSLITAFSMVLASRSLHSTMLHNILRSPMSFFDTTPIGRILNRFSRDIETIDNLLPQLFRSWMNTFFGVISTIVVISISTPYFLTVVIPLFLLYYFVQRFYIPTSRQLKRIESTSRSPIYVHFSETITGSSTIRAYGVQDRFIQQSEYLVDHNLVFYFASIASNRWLGFRLELVGALAVFAAAMFAVIGRGSISAGVVGLSISYALQVTSGLNWMVRMTCDLETNIVSVERVKEYSETPTEADWYIDESRPPSNWPDEGKVAYEDYSTRYRPGLDLVLKGITADVKGGEKIGIVGRTGAGKSSLTLSLFRIVEAVGGSIIIDGITIANLGLHQLRGKLTILPQDPVLFSGTLRMNLDPFDKYSDEQLWQALEHAHLKVFVESLAAGLEYECGEGGQNLSVGQRQLVCLARTLLRKTKILVLDEATAAVDLETDELIQNTIRKEFQECTVLTIAHRLNTVMDSDRVMVLDNGKIKEFDAPSTLLKDKNTVFYSLAKSANIVS